MRTQIHAFASKWCRVNALLLTARRKSLAGSIPILYEFRKPAGIILAGFFHQKISRWDE
ncbi:hypothetical protein HMPREF9103_00793 [Lentilactobacillus parafarraginis F0439]|uniref:Uncharacterized protein n=1 Tax=Lentilactobacillus parafarraginis F0439 TaxID=797515 RepID=G9ZM45_9LACO|nr:hypothetical protein HMPREF9103_00793 [Lentilactobacillus parafarraginis F0439]